jgi:hypothetical protein
VRGQRERETKTDDGARDARRRTRDGREGKHARTIKETPRDLRRPPLDGGQARAPRACQHGRAFRPRSADMTLAFNTILAVIDPTTDNQRALDRALSLAGQGGATVHAYLCCYSNARVEDFAALQRVEVARHEAWLAALATHYRERGSRFHLRGGMER